MRIKQYLIAAFSLCMLSSAMTFAQQKDPSGNYDYKKMSYEDAQRIFGPIKGTRINKVTGDKKEIKDITIKGNKITTILYNYGSVCAPSVMANVEDLVWNGLGYGYEFGTLAGAQVKDVDGNYIHIISDSHVRATEGDYDPSGNMKYGWLPKSGYSDPTQDHIASLNAGDANGDGKPDSWPENWYSAGAGKYLWPAFLGDMATAPDEEVYYGIDDYTNYEFLGRYFPFESDITKGGLGLDATVRILQFNNPMAEDIIFMIYQITNASEKDLDTVYFGMFGDPHLGGSSDYTDDRAFFIPPKGDLANMFQQRARSMVYAWDADFKGVGGAVPGYFGWKFLESPSKDLPTDINDDDDDGLKNESPFNSKGIYIDGLQHQLTEGIDDLKKYTDVYGAPKARWSGDEDGDWDVDKHDVGIDGIGPESQNYPGPDYGEGDGVPSQAFYNDLNGNGKYDPEELGTLSDEQLPGYKWAGSEPNFGYRDISESDMVGLTGFTAASFGTPNYPKNDDLVWEWFTKPEIDPEQELLKQEGDNVFCFSTGPMKLGKGESQRFSMAIIMGENKDDLILNAATSVKILEADYRFAQPPAKPIVRAVPGDGRVTLYWDAKSEESIDPLTQQKDFEGYKIYRSRDYNFADVYTVTDANGVPFLGQALLDDNTGKRAQFDLDNKYSGLAEREYEGRGVKFNLGNNTGLVHEYVDSTVQNGIKYYYAVVAYDRGTSELAPTETQAVIQQDPLTGKLIYDVNTLEVTPGPVSRGMIDPEVGVGGVPNHIRGNATGKVFVKTLEGLQVGNKNYKIEFTAANSYNVLDSTGVEYTFTSKDTVLVSLKHKNLSEPSIVVRDSKNNILDASKYFVNAASGQIAGRKAGDFPLGEQLKIYYRYYPVFKSSLVNYEDGNPAFDGLRVYTKNVQLGTDNEGSRFISGSPSGIKDTVMFPPNFNPSKAKMVPYDWEIRWGSTETNADGSWKNGYTVVTADKKQIVFPFVVVNVTKNDTAKIYMIENIPSKKNNKRWDWGESIVLFEKENLTTPLFELKYDLDSSKTIVMPKAGDVYLLQTSKPFATGDTYLFETKEATFKAEKAKENADNIYVVPNPYVGYSLSENPGRTLTKRGDREIQFRNLPPQCTIRIYTSVGELVDVIRKDDMSSIATWNLLSSEGMRIAYGVYIYHVDIPGVGEKIGRFAVIK